MLLEQIRTGIYTGRILKGERPEALITMSECVRSSLGRGVVKTLELIGSGPVVLVHRQKVGIKYKKPTLTLH